LLIVCAPAIAVAAGVFIATAAARGGSMALVAAGAAMPRWRRAVQLRCQAKRRRHAVKLGAAAALSSLTPPPRCKEIVHESELALFSFLSVGRFFGTIWAPAMKLYQKIVPPKNSFLQWQNGP
jgi:hypothetical protein